MATNSVHDERYEAGRGPRWVRYCHAIAVVTMSVGFAIVLASIPIYRLCSSATRLPLGSLDAMAVVKGQIYTHSRVTDRVQVYTGRGQFVRGFFVPRGIVVVDDNERIRVWAGHDVISYTPDGALVGKERYDRDVHHKEFYPRRDRKMMDAAGNTYRMMPWSTVWPRVEKVSPGGKREVVISQPFWLWLIQVPFPAFIYAFCGIGLYWTWYFVGRRYKKRFATTGCDKSDVLKKG